MKVLSLCVMVILVQQSRGYLKPEPPETHFFLKKNYHHQRSDLASVFFTEPSSTEVEMLCIGEEEYQGPEVEMLAHQICTEASYDSFSAVRKSELQVRELD